MGQNGMNESWKERLYGVYVSSGQALRQQDSASLFAARAPYVISVLKRFIPSNREVRILDLGCGHGAFLYFLKQAGYVDIAGVDISAEQVSLAHKLGILEVQQADSLDFLSEQIPGSVGVVLLMDVVEHQTRQELMDLLDKVFLSLQLGGQLIMHVPNAEGIFGMRVRYGDMTHEIAFTPQSIQQILMATGFQQVRCFEDRPIVHGLTSGIRRILWEIITLGHRIALSAETGSKPGQFILSQNMLVVATKDRS